MGQEGLPYVGIWEDDLPPGYTPLPPYEGPYIGGLPGQPPPIDPSKLPNQVAVNNAPGMDTGVQLPGNMRYTDNPTGGNFGAGPGHKGPSITQSSDEGYVIPGMGSAEADAWGRIQYAMGLGRKRGQELFGDGSLQMPGQMLTDRDRMFASLRSQMQGLTAPEFEAMRGRAAQGVESQTASNLRRLRNEQGLGGVTGAARTAGAQNIMAQGGQQRRELERDLLMKDVDVRRQGTQAMGGALGTFGGMEMDRIRREKMGQLGTEMGYAGLGSQIYGDVQAERLGQDLLKSVRGQELPDKPKAISANNMFADQPWTKWMIPGLYGAYSIAKNPTLQSTNDLLPWS